jgi:hypothetical protein
MVTDIPSELTTRPNGTLVYNGLAVGRVDTEAKLDDGTNARLILNLGWMKAAGLRITVQADPDVDHKRGGVVLER